MNDHSFWLDEHLNFIKKDMGYETQEEFNQDFRTLCPINMVDLISLEKAVYDDIEALEKYCKKNNKPFTAAVIIEELKFHSFGQFEESLEQRRDKYKEGVNVIEDLNKWRNHEK